MTLGSPWTEHLGHLALVVDDIPRAQWFFETVWQAPCSFYKETQLMVMFGHSLLVVKLSKDAVCQDKQQGSLQKQVLDHYGFCAPSPTHVDEFYQRVLSFALKIVKPPYDRSDGRAFYFEDPFGNLVEYFWFKEW